MNQKVELNSQYIKDIFHYLGDKNGVWEDEKGYHFILYDNNKPNEIFVYDTKEFHIIPDPVYDSTFKAIFLNKSERFQNFLNSIYFNQNNMEIKQLQFLTGDFNEIGKAYNMNSLRADIVCKGKVHYLNNLQKNNDTLFDIEIQINWLENLDDLLF